MAVISVVPVFTAFIFLLFIVTIFSSLLFQTISLKVAFDGLTTAFIIYDCPLPNVISLSSNFISSTGIFVTSILNCFNIFS